MFIIYSNVTFLVFEKMLEEEILGDYKRFTKLLAKSKPNVRIKSIY